MISMRRVEWHRDGEDLGVVVMRDAEVFIHWGV